MTTDIDVQLDTAPVLREEEVLETQTDEPENRMKNLEYDLAELTVENKELRERVEKLASRYPTWPKGYKPRKNNSQNHNYNQKYKHDR